MTLTIHMMTANLVPGDAIGNYVRSLVRILGGWGVDVRLYADYPNPEYELAHYPSSTYQPTGRDILWIHFSIEAPSLGYLQTSTDFRIIDSHGVTPPALFHGYSPYLESLCASAIARLPTLAPHADLAIAHTDYIVAELRANGFGRICKLPLVVDTDRFDGRSDPEWDTVLSHLRYLLFVGRVVPQKGLARALEVVAALRADDPSFNFVIVGGQPLPTYTADLRRQAEELGIADAMLFAGPISEPAILASFYRHARFYLCLSEWESFCVPLVEAMYCGAPVLGHAVEPIPETMGPGGVVLRGAPRDMARHIARLDADPATYAELQGAGQAHARDYTDQVLARALRGMFSDLGRGG